MKKISLQTKLEDCSVPQRYIDVIKREAEDIKTIFDLVSSSQRKFLGIKGAGRRFLNKWGDFLKQYDLYIGMWLWEILEYEPNLIVQYYLENGKLHSKLISSLNCYPESNIERSKREKFDPKTLQPFDKVLCRQNTTNWQCNMFSYIEDNWRKINYPFHCFSNVFMCAIPYNEDTKHLVGTIKEPPEYYRYWED